MIGRLIKIFGETTLARTGLFLLAVALALLPLVPTLPMLLAVCAALAIANGLVNPTLNGLASQMIDRSWQGRALGLMQSAGSVGRLVGPLLGGWLLMFDLDQPLTRYARTPFFAGAAILLVAFALAFSVRKPIADKVPTRRSRRSGRLAPDPRGSRFAAIRRRSPAPLLLLESRDEAVLTSTYSRRHRPRDLG